jgi:hypothetical protein
MFYSTLFCFFILTNSFDSESIWGKYSLKFPEGNEVELIFKSDTTFIMKSFSSMAIIRNEGTYEVVEDSIFLTYLKPSICNTIDTFANENHFAHRRDTLWIIDENEITTETDIISDRYYQTEKYFEDGSVAISKEWQLVDSSLVIEDANGNRGMSILRGRRIKKGDWQYFDHSGILINAK